MRATLADPALTRYAGRFVWLELDFDQPVNQPFLRAHSVSYTPTLLVVDPTSGRSLVSNLGGLSIAELERFLAAGESRLHGTATDADSLLAAASVASAGHENDAAVTLATRALSAGGPEWRERGRALRVLTWTLMRMQSAEACAETAAANAPRMTRGEDFGAVVLAGFMCSATNTDRAKKTQATLEPLAEEAVGLPTVMRDHRFQLYQQLMQVAASAGDTTGQRRWGHRWLDEIESIRPKDDDERSALDIARVDAAGAIDEPDRVLPALLASERAMPANYNASLRLSQMLEAAKRYDEALAACDRGLKHVTGPLGRSWLYRTQADVFDDRGNRVGARAALVRALEEAKKIGEPRMRDNNVDRLTRTLTAYDRQK